MLLSEIAARIRGLFHRRTNEDDLRDEIETHLSLAAEEMHRKGASSRGAVDAAKRHFGNVEYAKEIYRERRGLPVIETLLQDIRYGTRVLRKNPGFSVVALLTLALGIGATVSIFSVVNAVLLRPLPFPQGDRLIEIQESIPKASPGQYPVSAPDVADFRRMNHSFEDLGAYANQGRDLSGGGTPERVMSARTSAAIFRILRVAPLIGRTFTEDEDAEGHHVVILSYGTWKSRYGGDAGILGKTVLLDREPYQVVGVMPSDFQFPLQGTPFFRPGQIWTPIAFSQNDLTNRADNFDFGVIARLKDGATSGTANSDVQLCARQIQQQFYPQQFKSSAELEASAMPLRDLLVGSSSRLLWLLLGAVGTLLLIACANVANLLLTRGAERQKEISVRVALGAARFRLVRQLLVESTLLSLLGGVCGLGVALLAVRTLETLAARVLPRAQEISLDARVLWFTIGISVLCGIVFGTLPAIAATRTRLQETLKESSRGASTGQGQRRLRDAFVVLQMALAVLLVAGSGLLIRSFIRARETDPGFQPENVVSFAIAIPNSQYPKGDQVETFFSSLNAKIGGMPGVLSVGESSDLPLNSTWQHLFTAEGHEAEEANSLPANSHTLVDSGYFSTLRIPLIRGRLFTDVEMLGKSDVLVISDGMARRYWHGEDPIGRRLKWGTATSDNEWLTIIGVVGDVKQGPLDSETLAHTYEPIRQVCNPSYRLNPTDAAACGYRQRFILVRAQMNTASLLAGVRSIVSQLDPQQPIGRVLALDDLVSASLAPRRFNTLLLSIFGGAALLLAAVGIYGLLAYNVTRQTREFGVRMALGAARGDILKLVLAKGVALAFVGLTIGITASLGLTRLMASLLYDTKTTDPATFAAVAAFFLGVTLVACWLPAHRATKVDPLTALRYE